MRTGELAELGNLRNWGTGELGNWGTGELAELAELELEMVTVIEFTHPDCNSGYKEYLRRNDRLQNSAKS